jgi:hypothetical protein
MCNAKVHLKGAIEDMTLSVEELAPNFDFLINALFDDFPPEFNQEGLSEILPETEWANLIVIKNRIDELITIHIDEDKYGLTELPGSNLKILNDPRWEGIRSEAIRLRRIMDEFMQ